jgi:hypothetical protein
MSKIPFAICLREEHKMGYNILGEPAMADLLDSAANLCAAPLTVDGLSRGVQIVASSLEDAQPAPASRRSVTPRKL